MHGLHLRSYQNFVVQTYGAGVWLRIAAAAGLDPAEVEPMQHYDTGLVGPLLSAGEQVLGKPRAVFLEDLGTYLISHPEVFALRRLLRFGGADFVDFLHSLDDLPERARIALPDFEMPALAVQDFTPQHFQLVVSSRHSFFAPVFVGLLRAMADDYGALVLLDLLDGEAQVRRIDITVAEAAFADGRSFDLAQPPLIQARREA